MTLTTFVVARTFITRVCDCESYDVMQWMIDMYKMDF